MMTHTGPGLPDAMRAHYTREFYRRHQLRLVVDNACPKRDHTRGPKGLRIIYSGGPDNAA